MSLRDRANLNLMRRGGDYRGGLQFRLALPILLFVSVAMLGLSRLDHPLVKQMRWHIAEVMTPFLSAAMVPLSSIKWVGQHITDYFGLVEELDRSRDEAQRLRGWEWRAKELERKLGDLSAVARVVEDPALPFVTARVIANSSGAFVRSAMINAGAEQNIRPGYPVLNGDGLVGRVVDTGRSAARVLLLTDLNSRIPVHVGAKAVRAILSGDNGPLPRLSNFAADSEIAAGDEVSTSGIGGLFPRGLRIGVVTGDKTALRVEPHARLDTLEYLSVLFYESSALELINGEAPVKGADARSRMQSLDGSRGEGVRK